VIGTGINRAYPRENTELQETIARKGLLISQFRPDSSPTRQSFPMRNAVMSGYSAAIVVQRTRVRQRSGYLRNPLPAGPGVCYVCFGPAAPPHTRCRECEQHFRAADGRTADVVMPISYAIKREQHAFNLASYKRRPGSDTVRADLLALVQVFIADHGQLPGERRTGPDVRRCGRRSERGPILKMVKKASFDLDRCAVHSGRSG
jgi:hypothetical protein